MDYQAEYNIKNPYKELNGIRLVKIEKDYCEAEMEIEEKHKNGTGYVHGGAFFAMADNVGGTAARTDGRRYVTQSAHINFIKNVQGGTITGIGRVVSRGRKITIVQVTICDEKGTLLASVACDMYCLDDKPAK
mgnify:CR=1 FL=1